MATEKPADMKRIRVNTGMLGIHFSSRNYGYAATTLEGAVWAAKKFGRYKCDNGKIVKVTHDLGLATFHAIIEAASKSNGAAMTPAIVLADKEKNGIVFNGGAFELKGELGLDGAFLLVLDNPEFMNIMQQAALLRQFSGGAQIRGLPGEIDLPGVASLSKPQIIGNKLNKNEPFATLISYYNLPEVESYSNCCHK